MDLAQLFFCFLFCQNASATETFSQAIITKLKGALHYDIKYIKTDQQQQHNLSPFG